MKRRSFMRTGLTEHDRVTLGDALKAAVDGLENGHPVPSILSCAFLDWERLEDEMAHAASSDPSAAAMDDADPVVALARAWDEARFGPLDDQSDEGTDAFIDQVLTPIEARLMATAPVSRDGAVALLQAVERSLREEAADPPCWGEKFDLALISNVRRAIAEGSFA